MENRLPPVSGTSNAKRRIVVLGGGPSGLAAAWSLVQDGHHVTLLEKEPVCGGMAATFARGRFRYDYGPHNIHSPHTHLLAFLRRKLGEDFRIYHSITKIYFRGRKIPYPFEGFDFFSALNGITAFRCAWSFFWQRISSLTAGVFKDDGTYRTWLINRFGQHFFDIFFGPYTEKVWGISTRELSDIVAKRRIPVQSLYALVHAAISRRPKYHPEHSRALDSYYHRLGSGKTTDFFVGEILRMGGEIITDARIHRLYKDDAGITGVEFSVQGEEGAPRLIQADPAEHIGLAVLSTIPINQLVQYLGEEVPAEVRQAAAEMDYTAEVLLYLDLNIEDPLGVNLLYFSEPEFPFNRLYDVGKFSRDMVPPGQTALCLEITCTVGDAVWNLDDRAVFEMCIEPLERHGFLSRQNVVDYHTRRLTNAYPRFRVGYNQRLSKVADHIENSTNNLWTFGRQGLFTYINVDEALWMGLQVSANLSMREKLSITTRDLFPRVFET